MRINDLNFDYFNMKVNSFAYQPYAMEREIYIPDSSIRPVLGRKKFRPKNMQLVAEFRRKKDISDFLAELLCHDENIIDINDGFLYRCFLSNVNQIVDEYWNGWYRVTIPFSVIQEGDRITELLTEKENHLKIRGNWETECVYEITPTQNIGSFVIDGNTIRNMTAGKTITFDGEKKKIYNEDKTNKFSDCILKNNSFPVLKSGNQIISMNNINAKVVLKYTPIFV